MKTYYAKQLFDGNKMHENMHLTVQSGRIVSIESVEESTRQADAELHGIVTAGFIDIQVNGGGGVLFNDEQSPNALKRIMQGHASFGTTAMLPTLITDSNTKMQNAANAVSEVIADGAPGIMGLHFEGPHLSLPKKGIHAAEHVRPISDADLAIMTRRDLGKVMVTLAPENVAPDVIADLCKRGLVVFLGHSNADIDTVLAAIDAGAQGFTHLFNAMSGLTARAPGMISAALSDPRVYAGLIADLHHVHPYNCRLAYQCIGPERLVLVTDAMAHVGCDMQTLPWLDSVISKVGDRLSLEDGSLAGSCLDMAGAVRNMYGTLLEYAMPKTLSKDLLNNVLNMASSVPATLLDLQEHGRLECGLRADFVLLNQDLSAQATWISGEQVNGRLSDKEEANKK